MYLKETLTTLSLCILALLGTIGLMPSPRPSLRFASMVTLTLAVICLIIALVFAIFG